MNALNAVFLTLGIVGVLAAVIFYVWTARMQTNLQTVQMAILFALEGAGYINLRREDGGAVIDADGGLLGYSIPQGGVDEPGSLVITDIRPKDLRPRVVWWSRAVRGKRPNK